MRLPVSQRKPWVSQGEKTTNATIRQEVGYHQFADSDVRGVICPYFRDFAREGMLGTKVEARAYGVTTLVARSSARQRTRVKSVQTSHSVLFAAVAVASVLPA